MRLTLFLFLLLIFRISSAQDTELISLDQKLKASKHDTSRCRILIQISEYLYSSDPDTVLPISKHVIQIAEKALSRSDRSEKSSFLRSIATAYNNIGAIEGDHGNVNLAIEYYTKSLNTHEQNGYKPGMADVCNNLGFVYDNLGDVTKALEYYHSALKIQEEFDQKSGIALTQNNIGFIYYNQNDPLKALDLYEKSLAIRKKISDSEGISQSLNNIASVYEKFGDPKCVLSESECKKQGLILALKFYEDCLTRQINDGNKKGIAYSYNNMASIYRKYGDPNSSADEGTRKKRGEDLALDLLNKSLIIQEEIKNKSGVAYALNNMAQVYFNKNELAKALEYSKKSMSIANGVGYPEAIYRSAITLKNIYIKQNRPDEAFKMFELEIRMRDSLENLTHQKALITQNTRYEYQKKAAADSVLVAEEKKVAAAELEEEKTKRFALYGGLVLVLIFSAFMVNRFIVINRQKKLIENKEREALIQNIVISEQKHLVEEKQKEILDSIHYAKRIQSALIANSKFINENIANNFVYFNPKDIVSGDFYWATLYKDKFYLAVCDSTGHGVPGAFMSLLNMGFLSEAIKEKNIEKPNEIFDYVRDRLVSTISNEGQKDGMDGILLCIDKTKGTYSYAAANNEPILIRDHTVIELAKDKMPVGKGERSEKFTLHNLELQKGDSLYLYTDGFADQFGGPKGKKFKYKQLNELLQSSIALPLHEQKISLENAFKEWKGNLEQVDDVLIAGIKV